MTDSDKKVIHDSKLVVNEKNYFVTDQGTLYIKSNSLSEERKIGELDPENLEAELKNYQTRFSDLQERVYAELDALKKKSDLDAFTLQNNVEYLRKELASADAIGDFDSLREVLDQNFKEIKSQLETADAGTMQAEYTKGKQEEDPDIDSGGVSSENKSSDSEEQPDAEPASESEPSQEKKNAGREPEIKSEPDSESEPEAKAQTKTDSTVDSGSEGTDVDKQEKNADDTKHQPLTDSGDETEKTESAMDSDQDLGTTDSEKTPKKSFEADDQAATTDAEKESNDAAQYYSELAEKAEQLIELTDWPYVSLEFGNIDSLWQEGPDPGETDIKPYRKRIDKARESFEQKKQAHYEEQRRIREENLEKKKELLKELQEIINKEKWTATKEIGRIRNRWEQLKPIPKDAEEALEEKFGKLIDEFEDHKVDRLVRKKQKEEENLAGKLVILDKMDGLLQKLDDSVKDWKNAERELEKLNKQWHKIGRIPIDKNQETWDRYHDIQDRFHKLRFRHDKKYRQQIEKFLSKKKQLIQEAEALVDFEDLADAARKVNKLHRRWKKVGNLPQKDENELWDQFKAATDAFNRKKSENIDKLREQEEENLEEKKQLIQMAEELKDSEEWEATHDRMQQLMKQWKKIGPVPKKKSGKIWKQFKGAMDVFYDRRREHFKEVREDHKENLEEKKDILDKLKALKDHENPIQAVEEAKPLQEAFKTAGYVPIKHKNRMWKEYRETCDVIYDRFRAAKSAANVVGKENVSDFSTDDIAEIQKKQKQAGSLRKEISKLSSEMIQMKESLSYFKPSSKGSSLLDEVHDKIEKAEKEIEDKENLLDDLEKQIDQLTRDS